MKKRVFIQYNCIAHYRERIFELLSLNEEIEYTIIADTVPDIPFLKTYDNTSGDKYIRQIYSKTYRIKIPFLPCIYFQPKTIYLIIKERPDCVISLGTIYSLTSWVVLITSKLLAIPRIIWGHGVLRYETGIKWAVRKLFYSFANTHLLYGHYAKDILIKKGVDSENIFVVYNSLDYDEQLKVFNSLANHEKKGFKTKLGINDNNKVVIFTGRLQPVKKLDMLIHAIANLDDDNVHLILIGDGEQKEELRQISEERGISDNIHFLGASYDEKFICLAFGISDLCVIPSGAGLTIMHSLVYGTPVLLHDNLGEHFPEWEAIVEGETGFYYKYGDLIDLTNKMKSALYTYGNKMEMEDCCLKVINDKYNPYIQEKVFVEATKYTINKY